MSRYRLTLAAMLSGTFIYPVISQAADTLGKAPLSIVVTPTRTAQTADESLASVSVVTRAQIEQRQSRTVADALSGLPGLDIANNGGRGRNTSI
ncbi:MAG: TonB-dependent receptor plug domain-containing protein, partial [Alphaproteobacteria bacterium]|nr:TonB-dependent receptor plug domain-containing protein [Alphaproteobacteria bacterium]